MSSQFWPEISTCLNEIEKEKAILTKKSITLDSLTAVRDNINRLIDQLRVSLEQSLSKQYSSQICFALVAYFDEKIHSQLLEKGVGNWVPLQKDFYGAYNAGDLFYDTVDKLVEDMQTPQIVFKVFYFILKKGFLGKYRDSKMHINKYLELLKDRLTIASPKEASDEKKNFLMTTKSKIKPWHYYTASGAFSIFLLLLLYFTSNI